MVADVAELADALDSKFHFYRFRRVSLRFNNCDLTIDFIGTNALQSRHWQVSIHLRLVSQIVSQFPDTIARNRARYLLDFSSRQTFQCALAQGMQDASQSDADTGNSGTVRAFKLVGKNLPCYGKPRRTIFS